MIVTIDTSRLSDTSEVVRGVATALTAAALAAGAQAATQPRLLVRDRAPFTVSGAGFEPREHVKVMVTTGERYVHRLTTTSRGTFFTRFRALRLTGCQAYTVRATGDLGSRTILKVVPACPPPGPIGP
jgi:hypothetical protein